MGQKKRAAEADAEEGSAPKAPREIGGTKLRQKDAMSRKDFMKAAKAQTIEIGGKTVKLLPKEYSTGSVGFYSNQKVSISVNGVDLQLQANLSLTVVGSK